MTSNEILKKYFGYDNFREGQSELIDALTHGRDALGVMPTGAGKSLCYQVPAMLLPGVTIVVSPLISLMRDQVQALAATGIPAAFINSSLTEAQWSRAMANARGGQYKIIYIAPERLLAPSMSELAQAIQISLVAVDEAHCISQWGQDFRPSYLDIPKFVDSLPVRPTLAAFTATATPRVRGDILQTLGLENPLTVVTGFDRPNLYFEVKQPKDKYAALQQYLGENDGNGIVYCSTRKEVESVAERLCADGYSAARYHAGLPDGERSRSQDDFLYDRVKIIVATNAFGMGIDKSNVRFVIHYNMPQNVESYYQEAGRAGRDGGPADCVLFYSSQDVILNEWMIENGRDDVQYPSREVEQQLRERSRKRLRDMTYYCATSDCLRGYILKYFGESPPNNCGNCGNCGANFKTIDITIEAQKILSCVVRMNERYGSRLLTDVLRGNQNGRILELDFDKLSTFGICSDMPVRQLRGIIDYLVIAGYLTKTTDEYPIIKLGERASEVLRRRATVEMKLIQEDDSSEKSRRGRESKRVDEPPEPLEKRKSGNVLKERETPEEREKRKAQRELEAQQRRETLEALRKRKAAKELEAQKEREVREKRKILEELKKREMEERLEAQKKREAREQAKAQEQARKAESRIDKYIDRLFEEPLDVPVDKSYGKSTVERFVSGPADNGMFDALRALRYEIAKEQNVPAFMIFADSTLVDMCEKIPRTRDEFRRVSGVGQMKLEKYADRFLAAINDYCKRTLKS